MDNSKAIVVPRARQIPRDSANREQIRQRRPTKVSREALAKFNEPLPLPTLQHLLSEDELPFRGGR